MYAYMGLIYHCISNNTRVLYPYWPHNTPRIDQHGWKKNGTLLASALDGVWCSMSSNHPYMCWHTFNRSAGTWVGLIHHHISSQAMGSYLYWPYNTPKMDQHGWMKTGTLLSSVLDGVWCTISSNHPYKCWHPSQFIHMLMYGVDTPLQKQPSNGVTSILTTWYSKDGSLCMKGNWPTSCSCLWWCVMYHYHELQSSINMLTPPSIHQWMHRWGWYTIAQATKQGWYIYTTGNFTSWLNST